MEQAHQVAEQPLVLHLLLDQIQYSVQLLLLVEDLVHRLQHHPLMGEVVDQAVALLLLQQLMRLEVLETHHL